jgi:hypothetical protein
MSIKAARFRVLIPTTSGLVDVLLLTEEDPGIGRSVACIGGTAETADIAAAYNAFVTRPTGVIERLFGHSCYRLDLSGRVDAGSSWQLGILTAHALRAVDRLAQENDIADGFIWATGSVRSVDLTVGGVGHIPEKLSISIGRLKQEIAAGRPVIVAIPRQNSEILTPEMRSDLASSGIDLVELSCVGELWHRLGLEIRETTREAAHDRVALKRLEPSPDAVSSGTRELAGKNGMWRMVWSAAAGVIFGITLAFVGLIFNFEMTGKSVSDWIGEDGASLLLPAAALLGGGVGLLMARRNAGR